MSWIEKPVEEIFYYFDQKLNLSKLQIDDYYILFDSGNYTNNELQLYTKNEDCYRCDYQYDKNIQLNKSYQLNSKWPTKWQIKKEHEVICKLEPDVAEFGVYLLDIEENSCELKTLQDPVNIYFSILSVFLIYFAISAAIFGITLIYNKSIRQKKNDETQSNGTVAKKRIQSLDTFRGISIVIMVLVNYGGGQYYFLEHATWNGLYVADLVFPWFMWIMGVCIPISIKSALKRKEKRIFILLNILRRSIILFVLGVCLNTVHFFSELRIFGVLQRFALCYCFVAAMTLLFFQAEFTKPRMKIFWDILILYKQWIIVLIILLTHTLCIFLIDVPECGQGYLGPGGLHESGEKRNCIGGATGYIDKEILGEKHIFQYPTAREVYKSSAFDPEGPFGTLTSIFQVFLGVQAGTILLVYKKHVSRLSRWIIWALICGCIGGGLCGFSIEDGVIPINKNLWSLSFVLVTSSMAFILLSLLYIFIDILKWWSGKPFLFAGMNAIIVYVGHSITGNMFPFQWGLLAVNAHFHLLAKAVWGTLVWILVAFWLFKKKFFLSL